MSARGGFQPVLIAGGRGKLAGCPSGDVLMLYASGLPQGVDDQEELLDGWTLAILDHHVAACSACRSQAAETSDLMGLLGAEPLEEPGAGFWAELADGVMRAVDGDERGRGDRDNVIQLRPVPSEPAVVAVDPALRRLAWALVAAVVFAVGLGAWLERDPAGQGPTQALVATESSPEIEALLLDRHLARSVAAELGLPADPLDLQAALAAEAMAGDVSMQSASLVWLVDGLAVGDMEILDVSLPTSDPLLDLIALDDSDLAAVLRSLES